MSQFKLIGLKLNKRTTNENGQSAKDCGNLWQTFEVNEIAKQIPNRHSEAIYAVYFDYESDESGTFSYFIGCRVDFDTQAPENLDELHVPMQVYKKITAKGKMPDCLSEAWRSIWKADLDRSFGFDFERYDERSRDWENAEIDIYLSLRGNWLELGKIGKL